MCLSEAAHGDLRCHLEWFFLQLVSDAVPWLDPDRAVSQSFIGFGQLSLRYGQDGGDATRALHRCPNFALPCCARLPLATCRELAPPLARELHSALAHLGMGSSNIDLQREHASVAAGAALLHQGVCVHRYRGLGASGIWHGCAFL